METRHSEAGVGEPGSANGREFPSAGGQSYRREEASSRSTTPWGFWLVLASVVVIAAMYAVTMLAIGQNIRSPATAIAAMASVFPVISALVGTYFGVKAGLDGQDKAKEMMDRAISSERYPRHRDPG